MSLYEKTEEGGKKVKSEVTMKCRKVLMRKKAMSRFCSLSGLSVMFLTVL